MEKESFFDERNIKNNVKISNLKHIAFIMDGNRRWSKENNKDFKEGYIQGSIALNKCISDCHDYGIKYISVFAFSTSNFNRPKNEVDDFMKVFVNQLKIMMTDFMKLGVSAKFIGNISVLSDDLKKFFNDVEKKTKDNKDILLQIAFNYSSREEIINSIKNIITKIKQSEIDIKDINQNLISNELYTRKIPDPDLVIRTSGEVRISDFMLWQISFSELIFIKKYWPDFGKEDLKESICEYAKRKRNFGK